MEVIEAALTFCPCQMPPRGSETPLPAQPEERSPLSAMVELGPGGPCSPCAHCAGSHPELFNTHKTWMLGCNYTQHIGPLTIWEQLGPFDPSRPIKLDSRGLAWKAGQRGGSHCRLPLSAKARAVPVFSHFSCVFGNELSPRSWRRAGECCWCHLRQAWGLLEVLWAGLEPGCTSRPHQGQTPRLRASRAESCCGETSMVFRALLLAVTHPAALLDGRLLHLCRRWWH